MNTSPMMNTAQGQQAFNRGNTTFDNYPDATLLSLRDVCSILGMSESKIEVLTKQGKFPPPATYGAKRCYSAGVIRAYVKILTAKQEAFIEKMKVAE